MAALSDKKPKDQQLKWYRIAYSAFILLSLYFLFISKDLSSAVSNLGIALVFDPFDREVMWNKRPKWQKIWLLVHLALVFAGFAKLITGN